MVILIRIPSFAYCILHTIILSQRQAGQVERLITAYAASLLSRPKLAYTTLELSFNLFCPLITENSSRTRNPDLPITTSNPVHPHDYCNKCEDGSARQPARIAYATRHRWLDSTFFALLRRLAHCTRRAGVKSGASP